MATNFPTSVDSFTNPTAVDTLDSPPHDQQHADVNDAMEAVQTALLDGAPLHIDDANERVGIGTASPSAELDVQGNISQGATGSNAGRLLIDNTTDTVQRVKVSRGGASGQLAFHTGSDTEHVRITSTGNVGINDSTPSYTLDVNGDINATGALRIGGTAIGTWTSFTPSWTNLTVGNGAQTFNYAQVNDVVVVQFRITLGSTSSVGSGPYFALPVTPSAGYVTYHEIGTFHMLDVGSAAYPGMVLLLVTDKAWLRRPVVSGSVVTSSSINATSPFTFTTGDQIMGTFTYRTA